VQNEVVFKKVPVAAIGLRDAEHLVFYKDSADLVRIFGNEQYDLQDNFLNIGCTGQKAVTKVSDDVIALLDYTGPYLLFGGSPEFIGDALSTWWDDTLSDAQKEAAVVCYNRLTHNIYFCFPTYTTSPYTNGIVFAYSLKARRAGKASPWSVFALSDAIIAATLADDLHLITATTTKINDHSNASPDEECDTRVKWGIVQNPNLQDRINLRSIRAQFEGDDAFNAYLYEEGALVSGYPRALTDSVELLIERTSKNFEIELRSASSSDDFTFKSLMVDYDDVPASG